MHTIQAKDIHNIGSNGITLLRPCQYGINEQGTIIKTLYCTRSGRFYVHYPDGWHKLKPNFNPAKQINRPNMHSAYPQMSHFGAKLCHHLVMHAWIGPLPEGKERDHLNGNKLDWNADNLRYLSNPENRKWAVRCGQKNPKTGKYKRNSLRGIGLQPKHITYENLRQISELSDIQFEAWLDKVQEIMNRDTSEMSVEAINNDVAKAIGWVRIHTLHCDHCGGEIIDGYDDFHRLHDGSIVCDLCYDDLYC